MKSKAAAGGAAGAAAYLLVYLASLFGVDLPEPAAGAAVLVVMTVAVWFTRDRTSHYSGGV